MEILALFVVLVAGPAMLNVPAWLYAKKRQGASALLVWLPAPALGVWLLLSMLGVGPQSLANLAEVLVLAPAAVALGYLQVFVLDRLVVRPRRTTLWLAMLLIAAAVGMRLFMPLLPE